MPEIAPEFYVGYQPKAPPRLARAMRVVVMAMLLGSVSVAALLVAAQMPFVASRFEFLQYKQYQGILFEWPYPLLVRGDQSYLLAGEGKHGAEQSVRGLDGTTVCLMGSLIENGPDRMLELRPGSLQPVGQGGIRRDEVKLGAFTLTGEIVDTKCYFGVMNPGRGKVHRDCAARCISGGIPPGFLVRDASGTARTILLVGSDGRRIGRELLDHVGEPVTISGALMRTGTTLVLKAEPTDFRRE
jgi:hypothetical protein